ncbi:MAG: serine/threonine-protein kinase, partial [Polyangiales bacterium]
MGQILGSHFELLAEAARGGMGSVYRGKDLRTGRMVAIKVLNLSNPSDHIRFERECNVLAGLHHPNVVGYVAHGASPEGTRYLVQEWVDGITLSTQIQMLGLTAVDAMKVAIGVSDALAAAHAHGAVHRDVKPANIILDAGDPDRVKLVDFGIARMAADAGVLTRAGILVGTPSYMAPEQARGLVEITPAADVWALGCVLYEAISGRKAFGGRSPEAILAKALLYEPARLDGIAPEIPVALAFFIHNMLAKRAEDRPDNGGEVARVLREFLPEVPAGPIRKVYQLETQPTRVDSAPPDAAGKAARCFVMVTVPPAEPDAPPRPPSDLERISERHHLTMHVIDDGSVIL